MHEARADTISVNVVHQHGRDEIPRLGQTQSVLYINMGVVRYITFFNRGYTSHNDNSIITRETGDISVKIHRNYSMY